MKSPLEALLIHCVLSISSFISILSFLQYMLSSCNLGRLCLEVLLDFNFLAESSSADLRHKLALGYQSFLPPITRYESGCFIRWEENLSRISCIPLRFISYQKYCHLQYSYPFSSHVLLLQDTAIPRERPH